MDVDLRIARGFLSPTTTSFQFGILEKNQWAGEDRLLKESDTPSGYSIIALTNVKAFVISQQDAKKWFTKDLMDYIQRVSKQRLTWMKNRVNHLAHNTVDMAGMDPSEMKYDKNLAETKKRYPIATPYVITTMRKKSLLNKYGSSIESSLVSIAEPTQITIATKPELDQKTPNPKPLPKNYGQTLNLGSLSTKNDDLQFTMKPIAEKSRKYLALSMKPLSMTKIPALKSDRSEEKIKLPSIISKIIHKSLSIAASAPKGIQLGSYVPIFSRSEKNKISSEFNTCNSQKASMNAYWNNQMRLEISKRDLNKFSVGKRVISLMSDMGESEPVTPKAF